MSVYDNMAFGLKMRSVPEGEIAQKVKEVAEILDLSALLDRKPKQLSGGQRQRVALGRAIVRDPKVFLMDEPLSNLDAKLRVHMRSEIAKLHKRLNATTVYVTHDQAEAMTMGDRVVILHKGVIQQIETPLAVYNEPANLFVAGFIGQMNFVTGILEGEHLKLGDDTLIPLPARLGKIVKDMEGRAAVLGIRPEHFSVTKSSQSKTGKTTTYRFERNVTEDDKLAPQERIIFSHIKNASDSGITREVLCDLLDEDIKNGTLETVQEVSKLIDFYRPKLREKGLISFEQTSGGSGNSKKYTVDVTPDRIEQLGDEKLVHFVLSGETMIAAVPPDAKINVGTRVSLAVDMDRVSLFDGATESRLG